VLRHCWLGDRKGIRPVKQAGSSVTRGSVLENFGQKSQENRQVEQQWKVVIVLFRYRSLFHGKVSDSYQFLFDSCDYIIPRIFISTSRAVYWRCLRSPQASHTRTETGTRCRMHRQKFNLTFVQFPRMEISFLRVVWNSRHIQAEMSGIEIRQGIKR